MVRLTVRFNSLGFRTVVVLQDDIDASTGPTVPPFPLSTTLLPRRRRFTAAASSLAPSSPQPATSHTDADSGDEDADAQQLSVVILATTALVDVVASDAAPMARVVLAAVTVLAQLHALALPSPWDRGSDAMTSVRMVVVDGLRRIAMTGTAVAVAPEVVNAWRGVEVVEPTATPAISPLSTVDLVRRFNVLKAVAGTVEAVPSPAGGVDTGDVLSGGPPASEGAGGSGAVLVQLRQDPAAVELDMLRRVVLEVSRLLWRPLLAHSGGSFLVGRWCVVATAQSCAVLCCASPHVPRALR